jgi:hypothetical protein
VWLLDDDTTRTQDLKKGDVLGKGSDAVVSVFLLPGNHKVLLLLRLFLIPSVAPTFLQELKTKVVKSSANPVFNESFQFGVSCNIQMTKYSC